MGAGRAQPRPVPHVPRPVAPLGHVRAAELPVLVRLVQALEQALGLLLLRQVGNTLSSASIAMDMRLQVHDRAIPLPPHVLPRRHSSRPSAGRPSGQASASSCSVAVRVETRRLCSSSSSSRAVRRDRDARHRREATPGAPRRSPRWAGRPRTGVRSTLGCFEHDHRPARSLGVVRLPRVLVNVPDVHDAWPRVAAMS